MPNSYFNKSNKPFVDKRPKCTLDEFSRIVGANISMLRKRMSRADKKPEVKLRSKNKLFYAIDDLHEWHKNYANKDANKNG